MAIVPSPKGKPAPKPAEPKPEPLNKMVLKFSSQCACEGCEVNVKKTFTNIKGVCAVEINLRQQKVTVKGNVDLETLIKELKKKTGKLAELCPQVQVKPEAKPAESKPEPLKYKTWELKVPFHCEIGCKNDVERILKNIKGVRTVHIDEQGKVTVVGNVDLKTLKAELKNKLGKYAELWPQKSDQKPQKHGKGKIKEKEGNLKSSREEKRETVKMEVPAKRGGKNEKSDQKQQKHGKGESKEKESNLKRSREEKKETVKMEVPAKRGGKNGNSTTTGGNVMRVDNVAQPLKSALKNRKNEGEGQKRVRFARLIHRDNLGLL